MTDVMGPVSLAMSHQASMDMLEQELGPYYYKLTPATLAYKISQGDWEPAHHLLYISAILAHKIAKGGARIIISMPPRHGKSELTSVWTPVWILDRFPDKQIMSISYGADLAEEFGQRVRDIIQEDADPIDGAKLLNPECYVRKDSARVNRFLTVAGGGMRSVGLGGAVYGRGADILLLDDYYKNLEEAMSQEKRKKVWDWFRTVARSRLHKNGSIIVIATRWDVEDLSAQLLEMTGSRYEEIRLPAFAEANDPLGRKPGEALWPGHFPEDDLNELKEGMGNFLWSSIYQQSPKKISSDIFQREWIHEVDVLPHYTRLRLLRSWDKAGTDKKDGGDPDYTCGLKMAVDIETGNTYLIDMIRGQWSPGKVEKIMQAAGEYDGIATEQLVEEEPGSSGKASAERDVGQVFKGLNARSVRHSGDKFVRALPFFAAAEHGKIFMLRGPWNEEFLDECVAFPLGIHDDQVDVASQGYNHFHSKKKRAGTWGRTDVASERKPGSGRVITGVTWGRD